MILLPAVPIAEQVQYAIVVLQSFWVVPEEKFDSHMRSHLVMYSGGLEQLDQVKCELLRRDDAMRLVLRGRGYLGHLRLGGVIQGQNVATAHDVWLLLSRFADRVNEMSPGTPSHQAKYSRY